MKAKTLINKDKFEAVKFMREQRDRISREIADMDFKELIAYFSKKSSVKQNNKSSISVKSKKHEHD